MSIRNGYVVVWYQDWHVHTIHYKGQVNAQGAVTAYHRNADGSASVLKGQISSGQLTADTLRGRCHYSFNLSKQ
jgi:hypothetical protein